MFFNLHEAKLPPTMIQPQKTEDKENSALMLELNHKCQQLSSQLHKYKP